MHFFRRYASLIAGLVFVTSGPLAAWHVASEAVPPPPCHLTAGVATFTDAHDLESVPDGAACLACHLLQPLRVPVSMAGVPALVARAATRTSFEQTPRDLAIADHLPARAPPPPSLA